MAKNKTTSNNKNKNQKSFQKNSPTSKLKTETKHGILAIVFFVLALVLLMSAFNMAGRAGHFFYSIFYYLIVI